MFCVVESGDIKIFLKFVNCGKIFNIFDMNGDFFLFMFIVDGNIEMFDIIFIYGRKSIDLFDFYYVFLRK